LSTISVSKLNQSYILRCQRSSIFVHSQKQRLFPWQGHNSLNIYHMEGCFWEWFWSLSKVIGLQTVSEAFTMKILLGALRFQGIYASFWQTWLFLGFNDTERKTTKILYTTVLSLHQCSYFTVFVVGSSGPWKLYIQSEAHSMEHGVWSTSNLWGTRSSHSHLVVLLFLHIFFKYLCYWIERYLHCSTIWTHFVFFTSLAAIGGDSARNQHIIQRRRRSSKVQGWLFSVWDRQ